MDSQPRSNAGPVWKWVIDDVCTRMKPSFIQEGVDSSVLDDLRKTWEAKLATRGLIELALPAPPLPPAAAPQPTSQPSSAAPQRLAASGSVPSLPPHLAHLLNNTGPQGVQMLMQHLMARAAQGSGGGGPSGSHAGHDSLASAGFKRSRTDVEPNVPQRDGPADNNQGAGTSGVAVAAGDENDEELLSEDSEPEEEQSFENYLICQFEKVNRTSGGRKWKVNLKDGVLHSNGKDYVFTKATGEWSWT